MFTHKEEIEKFLLANKNNLLINKPIKRFFDLQEETFEDKYPISYHHIGAVGDYLSKHVSYFSFNQLMQYSFFMPSMPGRAQDLKKETKIPFGIPFGNFVFQIKGEKCNDMGNISLDQDHMGGHFKRKLPQLVKGVFFAKIASSSFFFWEVQEVLDIILPLKISFNKFFSNLDHLKKFFGELGVCLPALPKGDFNQVFIDFFRDDIVEDFSIKNERVFVPIANRSDVNCFFYNEEEYRLNIFSPFKREVFIPENSFGDSYKFYMNEMLDLKPPGFNISRKILDFLINGTQSILLEEQCWQYMKTCSFQIKNKQIYKNDLKVFFLLLQTQLNNIKYQARKMGLNEFYVCNLSKLSLEIVKVRKLHKKDIFLEY